jgi:hypothetical protein
MRRCDNHVVVHLTLARLISCNRPPLVNVSKTSMTNYLILSVAHVLIKVFPLSRVVGRGLICRSGDASPHIKF